MGYLRTKPKLHCYYFTLSYKNLLHCYYYCGFERNLESTEVDIGDEKDVKKLISSVESMDFSHKSLKLPLT